MQLNSIDAENISVNRRHINGLDAKVPIYHANSGNNQYYHI